MVSSTRCSLCMDAVSIWSCLILRLFGELGLRLAVNACFLKFYVLL